MCRSSSLVFIALCIFAVNSKPLETQDGSVTTPAPSSAILNDPDVLASFLEYLQQHLNGLEVTSPEIQPVVALTPQSADAPDITVTVKPLPAQQSLNNPVETQEKSSIQQWGNVRIITRPKIYVDPLPELLTPEQKRKQDKNAKYQFYTYMDDNIKGSFLSRAEVRNGLLTKGQYEYDDGFVHRTVFYEADENGYRIVREQTTPSSKTGHLDGSEKVQMLLDGTQLNYQISNKDVNTSSQVV